MKKHSTILFVFLTLLFHCSCSEHQVGPQTNASETAKSSQPLVISLPEQRLDTIVSSIISISATDFYKNQQPVPVDFRDVHLKYLKKPSGEELFILCGKFVTNDHKETPFATIKNSDYEQWIGANANTYCQSSQEIGYTKEDLSALLRSKLKSFSGATQ